VFELDLRFPNVDLVRCISRVANKVNLTENTKREAIDIMKEVSKRHISAGKDPMGLAASVLYVSCLKTGEDRNQTEIANASGVTDVTLRNRYKELKIKLKGCIVNSKSFMLFYCLCWTVLLSIMIP
jgi:transcription initiation factor TFIIB